MNWLRLYHDVLDDPKVQRLDPGVFKIWINLLCLASRSEPRGTLPDPGDIAFALRIDEGAARAALDELLERGLVEVTDGGLAIHNWDARQFRSDNVSERVRRHRRSAQGEPRSESVHETLRDSSHETMQESVDETLPVTAGSRSPKRKRNAPDTDTETETEAETEAETDTEQRSAEAGAAAQPANVTPIARGKRPTKAPERFDLEATHYDLAETLGFSTQATVEETARFLDWHRAKGNTFVDWDSAWRNWMRKAREIRGERRPSRTSAEEYAAAFDRLMNATTGTGTGTVAAGVAP